MFPFLIQWKQTICKIMSKQNDLTWKKFPAVKIRCNACEKEYKTTNSTTKECALCESKYINIIEKGLEIQAQVTRLEAGLYDANDDLEN